MTFFPDISFSVHNAWLASLLFIAFSTLLFIMIPKYNVKKFLTLPDIKLYNILNKIIYWLIVLFPALLQYTKKTELIILAAVCITSGVVGYFSSLFYFSISEYNRPVTDGIYKLSRHPLYISFIIITLGFSFLTESIIIFILTILYFLSSIKLMQEEEKMCTEIYGEEYLKYKEKVRMIL